MIWRSSLTHQDYMKYDAQPMTTKFSIRTGKAKPTSKETPSTNNTWTTTSAMDMAVPSTSQQQQQPQQQEREDTLSDEGDSMDDDDDDDLQPGGLNSSGSSSPTNQQVLFLNFTSDLSPQTTPSRKKSSTQTKKAAYRVNGVNILNRKNLDSKTAIERIQRRRENHNHVERRRRDTINNTIYELSQVVPNALHTGQKPHKGNILKATLDYILVLQAENQMYQDRLAREDDSIRTPSSPFSTPPPHRHQPHSLPPPGGSFPMLPPPSSIPILSPLSPVSATPALIAPSLRMGGFEKTYGKTCRY